MTQYAYDFTDTSSVETCRIRHVSKTRIRHGTSVLYVLFIIC